MPRLLQQRSLLLACVLLACALLYLPIFFIAPTGDDFWHITNAKMHGLDIFFRGDPFARMWERLVIAVNYAVLDDRHYLASLVSYLGFLLSIVMVYLFAARWWPRRDAVPVVCCVLYAFHSVNTGAVFQLDTISQLLNTVTILLTLWWFTSEQAIRRRSYHLVGVLLAAATFLTKETSVGVVFALPLVTFALRTLAFGHAPRDCRRGLAVSYLGILVIFALYMGLRAYLGASIGEDVAESRYHLTLSIPTLAKNMAMLFGSVAYLGSTLEILASPSLPRIAVSSLFTLTLLVLATVGAVALLRELRGTAARSWSEGARREAVHLGVALFMLCSATFPAILLRQVSEQYSTLVMPFFALAAGYLAYRGFGCLTALLRLAPPTRAAVASGLLIVYALWMSYGTYEKLSAAERLGERAGIYQQQLTRWHDSLPSDGGPVVVCFRGDPEDFLTGRIRYSVFSQTSLNVVSALWRAFRFDARPLEVTAPDSPDCAYPIEVVGERLIFPDAQPS